MALATFNPPVKPSPGTAHQPKVNLWEAEFGDGYSQPTPKGLNHIRKSVSLKWDGLSYSQMRAIVGFFEGKQGCVPFKYQPYGEPAVLKWTCKDWSYSADAPWKVSATLEQSFTLET
jgi:phage-related protein